MRKGFFIRADKAVGFIFLGSFVIGLGLVCFIGFLLEGFGLKTFSTKYGEPLDTIFFALVIIGALLFAFFIARWVWKKAKEESNLPLEEIKIKPIDEKRWGDIVTACALAFSLVLAAGMIGSGKFSIGLGGVAFLGFAVSTIIKSYRGEIPLGILKRIGRAFLFLIIIFL